MRKREWKFDDTVDFGEGPWENESDKIQWQDDKTGLPCLIVRNGSGALCGYAGVTRSHPFYGDDYNSRYDLDCHGGLTFSGPCQPGGKVCHVVEPGEDDDVWWFGFDCAHCGDYMPAYAKFKLPQTPDFLGGAAVYRNVAYVTEQVQRLAQQLRSEDECTQES